MRILLLERRYAPFNAGERAGFSDDVAKTLVEQGIGRYDDGLPPPADLMRNDFAPAAGSESSPGGGEGQVSGGTDDAGDEPPAPGAVGLAGAETEAGADAADASDDASGDDAGDDAGDSGGDADGESSDASTGRKGGRRRR